MSNILVIGANRGIGLELSRQYSARGDDVVAVCRHRSDELDALGVRILDGVDVTSDAGVEAMYSALDESRIDILVHNAGILRRDNLATIDFDEMLEQYRVNTIGPLRVVRALRDRLASGSKVGIITSRVGSIGDNGSGGNYGYRCSKAAANMVGMNLHHDLSPDGIAVFLLHPGYVATDMTGGGGVPASDSARGLIARLDELGIEQSGSFWHAEGHPLPW